MIVIPLCDKVKYGKWTIEIVPVQDSRFDLEMELVEDMAESEKCTYVYKGRNERAQYGKSAVCDKLELEHCMESFKDCQETRSNMDYVTSCKKVHHPFHRSKVICLKKN